jgi:sporulation protein YlmC with PRC-barrel domain
MMSTMGNDRTSAGLGSARDECLVGVKSLVENSVCDARGNRMGKLEEIVIDTRTGCVRHVVLAVGGILGIGRRRFAVPWSALRPDFNTRRCVVDVAQMKFTAVPVPDDDPWLQRTDATRAGGVPSRTSRVFGTKF